MRKLIFVFIALFLVSCNPMMHVVGLGMRKFNTSQNKYSKQKPYIKK